MAMTPEMKRAFVKAITTKAVDDGHLIEFGWRVMIKVTEDIIGHPEKLEGIARDTFFAGAEFIFTTLMGVLEGGQEATEKDLDRMTSVHNELEAWRKGMEAKWNPKSRT